MDVFGLWGMLLVMLREVGWWGAHHSWWGLHLGSQWWGAMSHVRGHERLKGLLGNRAPMLLKGRRPSWPWRVVLHLLMGRIQSGGWRFNCKDRNEERREIKIIRTLEITAYSHA